MTGLEEDLSPEQHERLAALAKEGLAKLSAERAQRDAVAKAHKAAAEAKRTRKAAKRLRDARHG